ncbi:MAG TPA: response regulator transcription factor, partial [Candidatus Binataceae bacterium]
MNSDKPIRVLIIDDHRMLRDALRILLEKEDGIELTGEAGDELEGIGVAIRTRPEVILLDIGMHGIGGIQTAHRLRHEVPRSKVLMLSQYDDEEYVLEALGEAQ